MRAATVAAHDRTGRAAGSGCLGRPASGMAGAGAGSVAAVPVARSGRGPGWSGCGVPAGFAGVRPAGDHAARVRDRAVALVPVLVGGRGAAGSGDPGRGPGLQPLDPDRRQARSHGRPGRPGPGQGGCSSPALTRTGVPNPVTGKAAPGRGCAPATVTHSESVLRGFYDFHCEAGTGPIVNPFPPARGRRGRAHAPHPDGALPRRTFRALPAPAGPQGAAPHRGGEVQSAVRRLGLAPRPRAGGVLRVYRGAGPGQQLITVIRKGTRHLQQLPASPDAFVWLRLYQAQLHGLVPAGPDDPLWWTLRRPFRQLTYHAAYRMFHRASASLVASWPLHDLRHLAACRMTCEPGMPPADVQWVLGHAQLATNTALPGGPRRRGDRHRARPPRPDGRGQQAVTRRETATGTAVPAGVAGGAVREARA